ncbi:uncharacterized protein YALI1_A09776g [Yarrowia lipolytica]|uniref:Uncharacterized protein n=1 Tax=Yarrowia lipolytica TaxID=4952 RepID=A0A1D8N4B7_YARLL|nr:hypothetical protein YALI1_A09776g [Yarrowia lipolytica]
MYQRPVQYYILWRLYLTRIQHIINSGRYECQYAYCERYVLGYYSYGTGFSFTMYDLPHLITFTVINMCRIIGALWPCHSIRLLTQCRNPNLLHYVAFHMISPWSPHQWTVV